jgi:outer membrane receptor for ferrienterochelin and colicins
VFNFAVSICKVDAKKMIRFVLILLFGCLATLLKAQNIDLQLVITADNAPVPFATAYLPDLNIGTTADSVGKCILSSLPAGKHSLEVSAIGFKKHKQTIEISTLNSQLSTLNIQLEPDENTLNEIVVTGNMREMTKAQSIVPVEIYTPKFFQRNPTPSLFEALQNVNGVRPQMQCNVCNTGDIHINGMEGPYTMVLIDGMPIVSGLSTVYGLSGIPNSMVQRLEIVKGPAGALYGSEAMGGIINVITKNPQTAPKFALDFNSTSYQEKNFDLATSVRVGKKVHSLLSANVFHFNKRYDINHDNFTDITLAKRASVFNKWSFERTNNRVANLAFRYLNENRYGGEMQWQQEHRGTDILYGESIYTKRWEILGNYQLPINTEKVTFNFSANQHLQDSYYGTMQYEANQKIVFGQMLWEKQAGKAHSLLLGINQRRTFYDDNTPITEVAQNHVLSGFFLQDEIKIHRRLQVLLGARYDYSNIHKHIFSPRLSAKYNFNEADALRFSAGNGFRVVNVFSEDHAALTGGRQVEFVGELMPERSWNTNLNYTKFITFGAGFVNLDASLFYTYYHNKIVADLTTDSEKIIFDNLQGFATNYGASLNTDWTFDNGIKGIIGATCLQSFLHENGTRQAQIQTPNFTANYALSYSLPAWGLSLDFTGYVTAPMRLPTLENDYRPEYSPWFNISNLQITKKWSKGIELYGGLKNIFNFYPKEDVIMRAFDPFDRQVSDLASNPNGYTFDPSYNYAPMQRIRGFLGVRVSLR